MKLKKILPIAAVAGVAGVVAPMASCSCTIHSGQDNVVYLNVYENAGQGGEDVPVLRNKTLIDLKKNVTYVSYANVLDFKYEMEPSDWTEATWTFFVISEERVMAELANCKVTLDNTPLNLWTGEPTDIPSGYFMYTSSAALGLRGFKGDAKFNSKFKIEFSTPLDFNDAYICWSINAG